MFFSDKYNQKISSFDEIEQKVIEGDEKTIKSLLDMGCNLTTLFHTYSIYSKTPEKRIETSQSLLFILLKLDSPDLFNYAYEKLKEDDNNIKEDFYFSSWEDPLKSGKFLFKHYKSHPGSTKYKEDPSGHIYYRLPEMILVTKQAWNVDSLFRIREDAITFFNTYKKIDIKKCEEIFTINNDLALFFENKRKTKQDFSIYPNNISEKNIVDFLHSWEKNSKKPLLYLLKDDYIFHLLNRSHENIITKWLIHDVKIDINKLYNPQTMNLNPQTQDYLIPLIDINKKMSSGNKYKIDFNYYGIDCEIGETLKEYMENFILIMTNPDEFLKKEEIKNNTYFQEIVDSIYSIQGSERFLNLRAIYEKHLIIENSIIHTDENIVKKRI